MKKYFTYVILLIGYIVLVAGIMGFIKDINPITTVVITEPKTAIKFGPMIFLSVFIFIIGSGTIIYILTEMWNWFIAHKQMFIIPFLGLSIAFIQLVITGLTAINTMIMSNANEFVANNQTYIKALMTLNVYTIIALAFIVASVVYSFLVKKEII